MNKYKHIKEENFEDCTFDEHHDTFFYTDLNVIEIKLILRKLKEIKPSIEIKPFATIHYNTLYLSLLVEFYAQLTKINDELLNCSEHLLKILPELKEIIQNKQKLIF
jgi:hypothetical protein